MKIINKIILLLIAPGLISILIRVVICTALWFGLLPILFSSLNSNQFKLGFLILTLILVELVASKLNLVNSMYLNKNTNLTESNLEETTSIKDLAKIFSKKSCLLFFHASEISESYIKKLLLDNNYQPIDFTFSQQSKIYFFQNYSHSIISVNLKNFTEIIKNNNWLLKSLIKGLKKNYYQKITLITTIDSINNLNKSEDDLFHNFYYSINYLSSRLKSATYLNIIVENLSKIPNFQHFLEIIKEDNNLGFNCIIHNGEKNSLESISENFLILQEKLIERLIQNQEASSRDYQLAYITIQQIIKLKEPIIKLASCFNMKRSKIFNKANKILISISFVH